MIKKSRLNKAQMDILHTYVYEYRQRGVMGEWWDFMKAIEVALKEIKNHRKYRRRQRK